MGQTPADLLFAALDADGDGVITKDEMRKGLTRGSHSRRNSGAPKRTKSSGGKERAAAGAPSGSGGASGVGLLLSQSATTRPVALRMAATSDESESQYGPPKSSAVAQAELKKRLKVQGKLLEGKQFMKKPRTSLNKLIKTRNNTVCLWELYKS